MRARRLLPCLLFLALTAVAAEVLVLGGDADEEQRPAA